MQQLQRELRGVSEADANLPPALRARILTQLEEAAERTPPSTEPARPWLRRYGFATSLAVNVALLVVLVYTGVLMTRQSEQGTPIAITPATPSPRQPTTDSRAASPNDKTQAPQPSAAKPAALPKYANGAVAQPPAVANRLAPPPPKSPPPAPSSALPLIAVPLPPPPAASAGRSRRDETTIANGRAPTRPKAAPAKTAVAADAAPPADAVKAPGGFGGGGFGGGGGAFGGGANGFAPSPPVPSPAANAPGAVHLAVPPPVPVTLVPTETTGGMEQTTQPLADRLAPAKPSAPAMKSPVPDRGAPTPIGAWPTVALPPGLDPAALGVESVAVTWGVDEQGRVFNVQFKTTGNDQIDGALRFAVHGGRYQPATRHGEPIKARLTHTFVLRPAPNP